MEEEKKIQKNDISEAAVQLNGSDDWKKLREYSMHGYEGIVFTIFPCDQVILLDFD